MKLSFQLVDEHEHEHVSSSEYARIFRFCAFKFHFQFWQTVGVLAHLLLDWTTGSIISECWLFSINLCSVSFFGITS